MLSRVSRRLPALFVFALLGIAVSGCGGPCKNACPRITSCVDRPKLTIGACIEACQVAEKAEKAREGGEVRFQSFLNCVEKLDSSAGPRLNITGHQCRPQFARCTRELSPGPQRGLNKAIHR